MTNGSNRFGPEGPEVTGKGKDLNGNGKICGSMKIVHIKKINKHVYIHIFMEKCKYKYKYIYKIYQYTYSDSFYV